MDLEKIRKDNKDYIDAYDLYRTEDTTDDNNLFSIYKYLFKKKIDEAIEEFNKSYNNARVTDILFYIDNMIDKLKITHKEDKKNGIVTYYNRDNIFIGIYEQNENVISDKYLDAFQRDIFQITGDMFSISDECRYFIKSKLVKRLKELVMD